MAVDRTPLGVQVCLTLECFFDSLLDVSDTLEPERLLVFHPKEGWDPLCNFLNVPVPAIPFPRVNSRDELGGASDEKGGLPSDPALLEAFATDYVESLRAKAFGQAEPAGNSH